MVIRAKRKDLLQTRELTEEQKLNSQLNIQELESGITELKSFPRRIVLELTNACNIKCIMCGRDEADFNKTFLDIEDIKKLEKVLHKTEEVTLFGWGEPTIHPQFFDILAYLDKFPVRKYFVTNGSRLEHIKDAIFDYNVDILAVSLDGACAETNDRIRQGSNFEKVVSGLKEIVKERKRRNSKYPYINFVTTTMKSTIAEIPNMVQLAHDIGIEEVKSVFLTVFSENLLEESLYDCQEEVIESFQKAEKLAKELDIKLKLPYLQGEDPAGEEYHKDCYVAWRDIFIGSDGFIRPCQSTPIKFSHISKLKTFDEIWNSNEYKIFRKCVNNKNNMMEDCKHCYQSSHANWNLKNSFIQVGNTFAPNWEKIVENNTKGI